jgi:hypothetical protein
MQEEVWKSIKDFENYEVSNKGNVRRIQCQIIYKNGVKCNYGIKYLKQENLKRGYKRVTLSSNDLKLRFSVHRLVASAFIPNNLNKPCVNHIDGNPSNNDLSNLEWCTYSENEKHSYGVLNKINPIRKLKQEEVNDIRKNCIKGVNQISKGNVDFFMKKYDVCRHTILNVLNNRYYV